MHAAGFGAEQEAVVRRPALDAGAGLLGVPDHTRGSTGFSVHACTHAHRRGELRDKHVRDVVVVVVAGVGVSLGTAVSAGGWRWSCASACSSSL